MEHRMSLRIPTAHTGTIKPQFDSAIRGELRNLSFDGAFLLTTIEHPESLLRRPVRLRVYGTSVRGITPVEIPAHVVRAKSDGVGLAFDAYDEAVDAYLERLYREGLSPAPAHAVR